MAMSLSPGSSSVGSSKRGQAQAKQKKTRSRNGCPHCKAKRLKCDETRPACLTCTRSGRKCPGYSQEFRWSTKHEKLESRPAAAEPSSLENLLSAASKIISGDNAPKQQPQEEDPRPLGRNPLGRKLQTTPQLARQSLSHSQNSPHSPHSQHSQHSQQMHASSLPVTLPEPDVPTSMCPELDLLSPGRSTTLGLTTPSPETFPVEGLPQEFWDQNLPMDSLGDVVLFPEGLPLMHNPLTILRQPFSGMQRTTMPQERLSSQQPFIPWIPRSLMDRSSMLVEEWFKHVCSIWSCYDSDANLNRKIAADTWTRSEAVMKCMQSMSATCLSSQIPQMRQVAIASLKSAIATMKRELKAFLAGHSGASGRIPTDLLLALCCVGTAACWIDTKQLAAQFLREARSLIDRINRDTAGLAPQEQQVLSFYNNSIIYWDMLVAVVSDEDDNGILVPQYQANAAGQIMPHPWTGVSAAAQRLFARAIRLCRRFRRHLRRDSISTTMALRTALKDISEAQEIEEELLGLEHRSVHEICDTGDRLTPRAHLVDVAEGYRLASLLQLYQTFPDLVVRRLPEDAIEGDVVPWDRWIVPLSLRLVNTLKKIPPDSGTRCIQPLLYLSASSGLKFDVDTGSQPQNQAGILSDDLSQRSNAGGSSSQPAGDPAGTGGGSGSGGGVGSGEGELELELSFDSADPDGMEDVDMLQVPLTKLSIEVSHARRFIMERLSALEHSLPPAPVRVAKELVTAIWAAYDEEKPGTNHTHWIDVMEDTDLRTIFG